MAALGGSAAPATDAFMAEACQWKFIGASVWQAALFALGWAAWHAAAPPGSPHAAALWSLRGWCLAALVWAPMLGVLHGQRRVLTTLDVPPLYVGRLGWSGKSWPSLLISRCLVRRRTLRDAADAALLYAAAAASGAAGCYLLRPAGVGEGGEAAAPGARVSAAYGAAIGVSYALGYLIRGKNVLAFPLVPRHRYFRIKQRMRALVRSALLLPTLALLPAAALSWLLGAGSPRAVLGAWRAGVLLAFGWGAGAHTLEVAFTERLSGLVAAGDPQPVAPLLAALQHKDPIVQDWALLELASVAEGASGRAAARASLFADETGASGWVPLARYCLAELTDFVAALSAALPAVAGAGGAGGGGGVRWNALQLSASGARSASRAQDTALWHLQARQLRLTGCLRVLSGLAAAGLSCDSYGLLQLSSPGLADVLAAHLGVVATLAAFLKHTSSIPVRATTPLARMLQRLAAGGGGAGAGSGAQQHVDVATAALLDTAKTCTYRLTNTYGPVLASVVAQSKPLVGSTADAQALLGSFLAHVE